MDEQTIAAIQARQRGVTSGPWWWTRSGPGETVLLSPVGVVLAAPETAAVTLEDQHFIAAARTDIPALLTALVAVTAERDRYRAALTALTDPAHEPTLTRDEGIEICAYCQQFAFHHAEDCPIVMGRAALAPDAPREGDS